MVTFYYAINTSEHWTVYARWILVIGDKWALNSLCKMDIGDFFRDTVLTRELFFRQRGARWGPLVWNSVLAFKFGNKDQKKERKKGLRQKILDYYCVHSIWPAFFVLESNFTQLWGAQAVIWGHSLEMPAHVTGPATFFRGIILLGGGRIFC